MNTRIFMHIKTGYVGEKVPLNAYSPSTGGQEALYVVVLRGETA